MLKTYKTYGLLILLTIVSCSTDGDGEPADTLPPTVDFSIVGVSIGNPESPPILGNTIEIEINAQDAKGISMVEAFLNDTKVGEDREPPFRIVVDLKQYESGLKGKGIVLNKTQIQYVLKVSATDPSGNVSFVEQNVIIDNEIPTLSELSLENDQVITGGENLVTFTARDNIEITSLEVKINESAMEVIALDSIRYSFNIDTQTLDDGRNTLSISASDQTSNTAILELPFFVDNTGPGIVLEGMPEEGGILDEPTVFSIRAEDLYSPMDSVKVFINDSLVAHLDTPEAKLDFDPNAYPTGSTLFRVVALDSLGNETVEETEFKIKRFLIAINVPDGFLDPYIAQFYIFASSETRELLDIKPLEFNTSRIKLNTFADISPDTDYSLSFAYLYSGVAETSIIKTIQNISPTTLDEIDLQVPQRKKLSSYTNYQASEMPDGASIVGEGTDYSFNLLPESGLYFEELVLEFTQAQTERYYIYLHNSTNNNYSYQFVNRPLGDFYLDYDNFSADAMETRFFNGSNVRDPDKSTMMMLYGHMNASEVEEGLKHRIWGHGFQNAMIMNGMGYRYSFNPNFHAYSYSITMEDHHIEAWGEPLNYYQAPDWNLDFSYSPSERAFSVNTTGTTHTVGKISMDMASPISYYTWTVLFDSQKTTEVYLPDLPMELQSWNINTHYSTGDMEMEQVEIKSFEGLDTYGSFLETFIKNGEQRPLRASDKIESIFWNRDGVYIYRPDFSFVY